MVISELHYYTDLLMSTGKKIPTKPSPEQKCRGQEGEQFHFREG